MHWTQEAHTKSGILVYKLRIKRQNVPIIYLYLTSNFQNIPPHMSFKILIWALLFTVFRIAG